MCSINKIKIIKQNSMCHFVLSLITSVSFFTSCFYVDRCSGWLVWSRVTSEVSACKSPSAGSNIFYSPRPANETSHRDRIFCWNVMNYLCSCYKLLGTPWFQLRNSKSLSKQITYWNRKIKKIKLLGVSWLKTIGKVNWTRMNLVCQQFLVNSNLNEKVNMEVIFSTVVRWMIHSNAI